MFEPLENRSKEFDATILHETNSAMYFNIQHHPMPNSKSQTIYFNMPSSNTVNTVDTVHKPEGTTTHKIDNSDHHIAHNGHHHSVHSKPPREDEVSNMVHKELPPLQSPNQSEKTVPSNVPSNPPVNGVNGSPPIKVKQSYTPPSYPPNPSQSPVDRVELTEVNLNGINNATSAPSGGPSPFSPSARGVSGPSHLQNTATYQHLSAQTHVDNTQNLRGHSAPHSPMIQNKDQRDHRDHRGSRSQHNYHQNGVRHRHSHQHSNRHSKHHSNRHRNGVNRNNRVHRHHHNGHYRGDRMSRSMSPPLQKSNSHDHVPLPVASKNLSLDSKARSSPSNISNPWPPSHSNPNPECNGHSNGHSNGHYRKPKPIALPPLASHHVSDELPLGWAKLKDEDGFYYFNVITAEKQRDRPLTDATEAIGGNLGSLEASNSYPIKSGKSNKREPNRPLPSPYARDVAPSVTTDDMSVAEIEYRKKNGSVVFAKIMKNPDIHKVQTQLIHQVFSYTAYFIA